MSFNDSLRTYAFYQKLLRENGDIYLVGGCVRDSFLKRQTKEFDLVVKNIPLEKLLKLLKTCGTTNLVGKSFGVIKFNPRENRELELDIALPRKEVSTGSGHRDFKVDYDEKLDIALDLARRDFTINAMARNLITGDLIDPFGGRNDIEKKLIKTVFANSFVEDPLRLLRAVQFAARFGFLIHPSTLTELKRHASLIETVAPERIMQEIKKLFDAPRPSLGFEIMDETGLLTILFKDLKENQGVIQPKKNNEDAYAHIMKALDAARSAPELDKAGDLNIMMAVLFHDVGKYKTARGSEGQTTTFYNHHLVSSGIAWRWMKQFKASTAGINPQHVCHLIKNHMFETIHFKNNDKALRRFINKVGPEHIYDLLDVRLADKKGGRFPQKVYGILKLREMITEEINRKPPFRPKDLALDGHDIMALGYKAGPVIGNIQRFLMEKVLDAPELNSKEQLTKLIIENKDSFDSGGHAHRP